MTKEYNYELRTLKPLNHVIYQLALNSRTDYIEYLKFENKLVSITGEFLSQSNVKIITEYEGLSPLDGEDVPEANYEFNRKGFEDKYRLIYRYSLGLSLNCQEVEYHYYADYSSFYFTTKTPIDTSFIDPEYFEVTCEESEVEEDLLTKSEKFTIVLDEYIEIWRMLIEDQIPNYSLTHKDYKKSLYFRGIVELNTHELNEQQIQKLKSLDNLYETSTNKVDLILTQNDLIHYAFESNSELNKWLFSRIPKKYNIGNWNSA